MPRNNFGKYFLSGFQSSFNPTFQNVLNSLQIQGREKERRKWLEQQKEEERQREQGQRNTVIDLLQGGETARTPTGDPLTINKLTGRPKNIEDFQGYDFGTQEQGFQKPLSQEDILGKLGQLDTGGLQYYNALKGILTPKEPKKAPTLSAGGAVYGYKLNPQTNQLELDVDSPLIPRSKKVLTTQTGWGKDGKKRTVITYDDGSTKEISTGGFVRTTSDDGSPTEKFDLNNYRKTLNSIESDYKATKKKMKDFGLIAGVDPFDEQEKEVQESLNNEMDQNEQIFFNTMIPTAQKYIKINYYNKMPEGFDEYGDRGEAQNFTQSVLEDYKDGGLDAGEFGIDWSQYPKPKNMEGDEWERQVEAETFKSILQWIKLKFDRL